MVDVGPNSTLDEADPLGWLAAHIVVASPAQCFGYVLLSPRAYSAVMNALARRDPGREEPIFMGMPLHVSLELIGGDIHVRPAPEAGERNSVAYSGMTSIDSILDKLAIQGQRDRALADARNLLVELEAVKKRRDELVAERDNLARALDAALNHSDTPSSQMFLSDAAICVEFYRRFPLLAPHNPVLLPLAVCSVCGAQNETVAFYKLREYFLCLPCGRAGRKPPGRLRKALAAGIPWGAGAALIAAWAAAAWLAYR